MRGGSQRESRIENRESRKQPAPPAILYLPSSILAALFSILVFLTLTGCVTRPKTYHAPDATKFNASSKKLGENIEKTGGTISRAQVRVSAAQKNYDQVASASVDVRDKVVAISKVVPLEFLPEINQLLAAVDAKILKEGELAGNLDGANAEIEQAKKDNAASAVFKAEVQSHFETYQLRATQSAAIATEERNARIVAEKQIVQQKIFRILWKIGGGLLVLGIIALIVLWFLGKVSIKGLRAYFRI